MEVFKEYLLQNWALILVLIAFAIMLKITVFLDKRKILRLYLLIISVFLLSIVVFTEFYLADINQYQTLRVVMMAIRYSATPLLLSYILFTLVKKARWYVFIPALFLTAINIVSIFTGIVFSINEAGELQRGVLGYLPYVGVGVYSAVLVFVLIWQSNKTSTEIIQILFLTFAFASGVVLPLVIGKDYSKIFTATIAIALFVYYVFLILQLTKKDSLTGLFNRQAYYAFVRSYSKDITAFVSIDMNGLKKINDSEGHLAGDKALSVLGDCFQNATKNYQYAFRVGGDEFIIICRKMQDDELKELIDRIKENVSKTEYTISIGYCYSPSGLKDMKAMVKESDEMMYKEKASFYQTNGIDRRIN